MTDISPLVPALPGEIDGFRVEIDPAHERGDIVLDRPPLNLITMAEREQLRVAFEVLDADPGVRVIVLRAVGEHFSSGGEIGAAGTASGADPRFGSGRVPAEDGRHQPRQGHRHAFASHYRP